MTYLRVGTLAALMFCCAGPVSAQAVRLEFHDGKVNLTAQNASVRNVLSEWARLGGTQVVNAERVSGAPVTLQLTDIPETQALDILLRGTAGYIAGERTTTEPAGTRSSLDRIMIVPTAGTASVAAVRPGVTPPPFVQQVPQPFIQPDPDDNPTSDVPPDDDRRPRSVPPVLRLVQPGNQAAPQPSPVADDQPPQPAGTQQAPANPFGIQTGTSRPGMVTPAPAPQPQRPPNTRDQEP
jgi:hypothetical protein